MNLRVMVAHNLYRSSMPSGENNVVQAEIVLLREAGVDVVELVQSSDEIPELSPARKLGVAAGPVYNPWGVARFRAMLAEHRPDVVHLHNVFPLLSPWVVRTAHAAGVPVVQTVHNYRHTCVNGLRYRDARPCDDCLGHRLPLPAVRHGCYRGSHLQSLAMAVGQAVHKETWKSIDRFIALTPFMRADLLGLGVSPEQVVLRPTPAPDPGPPTELGYDVVFLGRLDEMKGPDVLLEAWLTRPPPERGVLRIVGSGPLLPALQGRAAGRADVDVAGSTDAAGVGAALRGAALVVIPSGWYEGQPVVYVEALAHGRPVLASDLGGLQGLDELGVGWSVPPTVPSLAQHLDRIGDREELARRGAQARREYESKHSPQVTLDRLLEVYHELAPRARLGGTRRGST